MHIKSKLNYRFRRNRLQVSVYGALELIAHSVSDQLINILLTISGFSNSMYLADKRCLYYLGTLYAYEAGKYKSLCTIPAYNNGIWINFFKPARMWWTIPQVFEWSVHRLVPTSASVISL